MSDIKTVFTRTNKPSKAGLKGQALVILQVLDANKDRGFTIVELTNAVGANLVTRQDPERVVAYYLCIFKKQGIVSITRPEPQVATPAEQTTEPETSVEPAATEAA